MQNRAPDSRPSMEGYAFSPPRKFIEEYLAKRFRQFDAAKPGKLCQGLGVAWAQVHADQLRTGHRGSFGFHGSKSARLDQQSKNY